MRLIMLACAVLAAGSLPASAAREFDTTRLTCAQANDIVQARGSVVMDIGRNGFERFVSSRGFCDRDQILIVRNVPAADTSACGMRWVCFRPKRGSN